MHVHKQHTPYIIQCVWYIWPARQTTEYTNTQTPKDTPHILRGKTVSAFEFAYSDKRQVPKNASVSSLLGQWRLSQYHTFSKKCGVTQEFTLSHHSRLGEIPIYYLSFFCILQHVFCFGLRQRWTVVGGGNQWKLFLFLAAVEVASCSWRTKTAKFAFAHNSYHDITIIVNTMMVNNFLFVHWTNILTPLTFWFIPFKACKFLFHVWFYSLTSDSCWYEFSILKNLIKQGWK